MNQIKEGKYIGLLSALFISVYLLANLMAGRLIQIGSLTLPGGVFFYPLAFLLSDVIVEVYGFAVGRRIIWESIISRIVMLIGITIVLLLPTPGSPPTKTNDPI